jgi:hypothetical protein
LKIGEHRVPVHIERIAMPDQIKMRDREQQKCKYKPVYALIGSQTRCKNKSYGDQG